MSHIYLYTPVAEDFQFPSPLRCGSQTCKAKPGKAARHHRDLCSQIFVSPFSMRTSASFPLYDLGILPLDGPWCVYMLQGNAARMAENCLVSSVFHCNALPQTFQPQPASKLGLQTLPRVSGPTQRSGPRTWSQQLSSNDDPTAHG